jgi:hypothetical protein
VTYSIAMYGMDPADPDNQDGPFELCSVSAWTAFRAWADKLPPAYPKVKGLASHGKAEDTFTLSRELVAGMAAIPPRKDVRATVDAMLDRVGIGASTETLVLFDEEEDEDDSTDLGGEEG